ncbi:transcription factor bHLH18-like [Panicum miliaceum]|uniref:Transcription factor bHLH18-like n=1 Tax=Panicum miliaceum TaxID=4540 RepID=A0A3L6S8Q8_PANMI|nr:transcription factor bHLH18-like [Panicum miliaceum]
MEDSTQFMQWALSTLQHEQPPPGTPAPAAGAYDDGCGTTVSSIPVLGYSASVDSMVPGEPLAREGQRASNSWSSVDTDSGSGGGSASATAWSPPQHSSVRCAAATAPGSCSSGTTQPVSWDFNSASAQLIKDARPNSAATALQAESGGGGGGGAVPQMTRNGSPPTRRASAKISASSSSAPYSQDHIIAERKRREKINQRFIELSTVIPGLKKMDKATILSDATRYVRELQEKLRALQQDGGGGGGRGMESAVLASKKPRIAAPDDDEDGGAHPYAAGGPAATTGNNNALPEIEVRISEGDAVMVRIHCRDAKGVVVRLLAEVEGLHLSITHTNVVQFFSSVLIVNVMAKVEQGFNSTADDIVGRLNAALHALPLACQK